MFSWLVLWCLLLTLPAWGGSQLSGHLASTTTFTPLTWEEEIETNLTVDPVYATVWVDFTQAGFEGARLGLEYIEDFLISNTVSFGKAGFNEWRAQAQIALSEEATLMGNLSFDLEGFAGGELGLFFNPLGEGFQDVGIAGFLDFDGAGISGQKIRLFADLGVFSLETAAFFGPAGFQGLQLWTSGRLEEFALNGSLSFVPEGFSFAGVGVQANFDKLDLSVRTVFTGQGLSEAQADLSLIIFEKLRLSGSALFVPAGFIQSILGLTFTTPSFSFAGRLTFSPLGFAEANLDTRFLVGDLCFSGSMVWSKAGFEEARLRIEVPFAL